MSKSKVSIIIRTKNEERWIGHCLKRIHSQNYENYEIILVDSESEDNTVEKAQRIGIDKLVKIKNYRPGFAINEGINISSGEFIIILSAHCLPISNNWIKEMVDEQKPRYLIVDKCKEKIEKYQKEIDAFEAWIEAESKKEENKVQLKLEEQMEMAFGEGYDSTTKH